MELLLVLGVYALYLQDSALLLHYDELVLVHGRRRWSASCGGPLEFQGRRLFLPHPWRPTHAMFRASWLRDADDARPRTQPAHFLASLDAVRGGCRWLWTLLLVVLPLMLWRYPHPLALLALTAAIYLATAWLAWRVWRFRRVFELQQRQALSIGFELLCCPPHAINLVRRLSLRRGLHEDAIGAVQRRFDADGARVVRDCMRERLVYAMDFHGEQARLVRARERLEEAQ